MTCASASGYGEETLAPSSPAVTHPEWVVRHSWTENGTRKYALFFDPALPEVRKLICDGVEELIENYGIDGIHFDDYFYPYSDAASFDDGESYEKYGNGQPRDDWRRSNANELIEAGHGGSCGPLRRGVRMGRKRKGRLRLPATLLANGSSRRPVPGPCRLLGFGLLRIRNGIISRYRRLPRRGGRGLRFSFGDSLAGRLCKRKKEL